MSSIAPVGPSLFFFQKRLVRPRCGAARQLSDAATRGSSTRMTRSVCGGARPVQSRAFMAKLQWSDGPIASTAIPPRRPRGCGTTCARSPSTARALALRAIRGQWRASSFGCAAGHVPPQARSCKIARARGSFTAFPRHCAGRLLRSSTLYPRLVLVLAIAVVTMPFVSTISGT